MKPNTACGTDPLTSAAECLVKLGLPSQPLDKANVEKELEARALEVESGRFSEMEEMLMAQAQVLHRVFTHAVGKYADHDMMPETARLYGAIGLRAQSYCRQTVMGLAGMKHLQAVASDQFFSASQNARNELLSAQFPFNIKESHYAPLDKTGTPTPSSADSWLAAMEQSGREDR